jgi:hypothetical protein
MEELEAADWYNQRVDACKDDELRAILLHNRDEEKEHAAMVLEWIRRNDPLFDQVLRTYLFSSGSIAHVETEVRIAGSGEQVTTHGTATNISASSRPQLTVGSLLGK